MITTTLNRIRANGPCHSGWTKLLAGLNKSKSDDEPLSFARIVEINGLQDALWCCRAEPRHAREWRLFAVFCARQVQHLMKDPRSMAALDVAERHANGRATDEELLKAAEAAWQVRAAEAAAAWAAEAAAAAAEEAAEETAEAAAWAAAWAAQALTGPLTESAAEQTQEFLRVVQTSTGQSTGKTS